MGVRCLTPFPQQLSELGWERWGNDAFFVLVIQFACRYFFVKVVQIHRGGLGKDETIGELKRNGISPNEDLVGHEASTYVITYVHWAWANVCCTL